MRNRQQFEQLVFEKAEDKKKRSLISAAAVFKYTAAAAAVVVGVGLGTALFAYGVVGLLGTKSSTTATADDNGTYAATAADGAENGTGSSGITVNEMSPYDDSDADVLYGFAPEVLPFLDRVDYTANGAAVRVTDSDKVAAVEQGVKKYIDGYGSDEWLNMSEVEESPELIRCRIDVISYASEEEAVKTTVVVYSDGHINVTSDSYVCDLYGELVTRLERYEDVEVGGRYKLTEDFVRLITENVDENFTVDEE